MKSNARALTDAFAHGDTITSITLANVLTHASASMFNSARTNDQTSPLYILLTQLLANLSICICISSHELWYDVQPSSSSPSFWRHLLAHHQQEMPALSEIQETLDRGVKIYERLKRLNRRIKGEEYAYEGILIVRERK
jgi:hypothetical protein